MGFCSFQVAQRATLGCQVLLNKCLSVYHNLYDVSKLVVVRLNRNTSCKSKGNYSQRRTNPLKPVAFTFPMFSLISASYLRRPAVPSSKSYLSRKLLKVPSPHKPVVCFLVEYSFSHNLPIS